MNGVAQRLALALEPFLRGPIPARLVAWDGSATGPADGKAGGESILWLISDDNFSAFQRSLLVRIVHSGPAQTREKAPGSPERPSRSR